MGIRFIKIEVIYFAREKNRQDCQYTLGNVHILQSNCITDLGVQTLFPAEF
jgi:hypothetical protein